MNTRATHKPLLASAALAGALAVSAATAIAAQHPPKEGKFAYRSCWSGTSKVIALSKTHVAFGFEFTGAVVGDEPGSLFDHASFRCEGVAGSFGKERFGHVICLAIDPSGDKNMTRYTLWKDGKYHREDVGGTGKYEGMVAHAEVEHLGPFPTIEPGTFQDCNHIVGTYKLK